MLRRFCTSLMVMPSKGMLMKASRVSCQFRYSNVVTFCYLLFAGSYAQAVINLDSTSAVMEVSMSWLYLPGMLFAILGGLIILTELLRLLGGKLRDDELVTIQESEETPHGGDQNKV